MSLSGKRTRRYHKNDFSSDSEGNDTLNNYMPPNNNEKQESIFHPE